MREDVKQHVAHLRTLVRSDLSPGERARLEGENTALRSDARLAQTDRDIARQLTERLFHVGE